MASASADDFSLTDTFKSLKHFRHQIMDVAMITSAIGLCVSMVASGGMIGFLDPFLVYAKMYIPDISGITGLGEFFNAASQSAEQGVFLSDTAINSGLGHSAHGGAHDAMSHVVGDEVDLSEHASHGDVVGAEGAAKSACSITEHGGVFADWVASLQDQGMYEMTKDVADTTYGGMGQMFESAGHCDHGLH